VSAVLRWEAGSSLGSADATLTSGSGQPTYTWFGASADLGAHAAADIRVGYRVAGGLRLSIEAGVARPVVNVRIQGDVEGAADQSFPGETLLQWTLGARADYDLGRLRFASGRATPFVSGGAGVLWQVHEGRASKETGRSYQAGGGVTVVIRARPSSRLSMVALAADLRVSCVTGGVNWGRDARAVPSFGAGLTTRWGRVRKAA
jgi:hypothetical protein